MPLFVQSFFGSSKQQQNPRESFTSKVLQTTMMFKALDNRQVSFGLKGVGARSQ